MTVKTTVRLNGTSYENAEDVVRIIDITLSMLPGNTGRMPVETTHNTDHAFVIETEDVDTSHSLEAILRIMLPYVGCKSFTLDRWARYEARDQNGDVLASANDWGLISTEFANWIKAGDPDLIGSGIMDTWNDEWAIRIGTGKDD